MDKISFVFLIKAQVIIVVVLLLVDALSDFV
jgi:hypothetical protein